MIPANDFIAKLRMEPDNVLKQMADMHQNDPYLFPMIFQEAQARKDMRAQAQAKQQGQATPTTKEQDLQQIAALDQLQQPPQMGQPAPPAGSMPQAPNTPSGMPLQGPGSGAQMLPEQQGIGALPAQNLQGMGHAQGGIIGYAVGGAPDYSPDIYKRYAIQQAQKMGLPTAFVDSIFHIESGYKPNAVPKDKAGNLASSAVGIGQLKPNIALAYGIKPEDRTDGFKNIDASLAFMKDLQSKYDNDPQKMAIAYNQGETFLNRHLKENDGQLVPEKLNKPEAANYLKKLGEYIPISSAQAEPLSKQTSPAVSADEWNDASPVKAGMPDRTGVGATGADVASGALGVAMAPGVHGLAHELLNVAQFKPGTTLSQALGRAGLASSVPAGVLTGGIAASNAAMGNLGYLPAEQRNEMANNPMLSMMSGDTGLASAIMDAAANNPQGPSDMPYAEQMQKALGKIPSVLVSAPNPNKPNVALTPSNLVKPLNQPLEAPTTASSQTTPNYDAMTNEADKIGLVGAPLHNAPVPLDSGIDAENGPQPSFQASASAPASAPAKGGRDWNDFLLNLGLGMMAGKSPYAFQNLGEAGIGALRQEQEAKLQGLKERQVAAEERKSDIEAGKAAAEAGFYKQHGAYFQSMADLYNRGAKDRNNQLAVDQMIEKELAGNKMLFDPAAKDVERRRLQGMYYPMYGINSTMPSVGGGTDPLGLRTGG